MSSPVKLATPYPTIEEAAEVYGISANRLDRLKNMVQDLSSPGKSAPSSTPVAGSAARKTKGAKARSRVNKSSPHAHTKKRTTPAK
ncbi:MAG: hypothetical protein WCC87_03810 [Candidatus Korobacteraceae bacterium]